jgi:endonuclease/exonuclease/phosphatase family metal-dependent hydrolase
MKSTLLIMMVLLTVFRLVGYFSEPHLTNNDIHAITGDPARTGQHRPATRSIKLVTWNIERGVQFERIAETLQGLDADVILLQEVDRFCRRSANRDVARELAGRLGLNWISAGEFQEVGEATGDTAAVTGQAILSRYPITDPAVVRFSDQTSFRWRFNPLQPRRGGRMALGARTAGLLVYSIHLESGGDDELRTRQLGEVLADESRAHAADAVIAGDFNNAVAFRSFMFSGLTAAGFVDALGVGGVRPTTERHRQPIDWMFVKGAWATSGRVVRVEDASDHYPVVATLTRR